MIPAPRSVVVLRGVSVTAAVLACFTGLLALLAMGAGRPCPTGSDCAPAAGASVLLGRIGVLATVCVVTALVAWFAGTRVAWRAERAADPWADVREHGDRQR